MPRPTLLRTKPTHPHPRRTRACFRGRPRAPTTPIRARSAENPHRIRSAVLKQAHVPAERGNTVGIEDRWYMRRTPPPSRPPVRPSPQPLPRRRTGAAVSLLILALIGIILILATALASVEVQRCREGLQAPVCRI